MASTMAEALRECFSALGGIRTKAEIGSWIRQHYPRRWKLGTLIGHLYGTRVNHPLAFRHHPGQPKFLFDHGSDRYELHDASKHGTYRNGRLVSEAPAPGWILVHSHDRYVDDEWYDSPQLELADDFHPGIHWHWKLRWPMGASKRPRTLLLAWDQCVFGEATATITQKIGRKYRRDFNFAFVLKNYRPLKTLIPFSVLRLGSREHNHRGLIKLDEKILAAYQNARDGNSRRRGPINSISQSAQFESLVESAVNPQKGTKQGFGLTKKEKDCVELHAMGVAQRYLAKRNFCVQDVSRGNPYDYSATKGSKTIAVEVKGTTGAGSEIFLTKNEVEFQRLSHPANMLIVVHSISLERDGTEPRASGGKIRKISPWRLDDEKLKPYAYSYKV